MIVSQPDRQEARSAATISWKDGFVDARFTASETTEWEQLVAGGMDRDKATATLIARRSGDPAAWAFADALLALEELGHADVAERLRHRWPDVKAAA